MKKMLRFSVAGQAKYWTRIAAGTALACFARHSAAGDTNAACHYFRDEIARFERQHPTEHIARREGTNLCFENFQRCSTGDIVAERFWETARSPVAAASVKGALMQYMEFAGRVTRISVAGHAAPIVRISGYAGTANCIRDVYLERDGRGYQIVHNQSLDKLSQEAGYCSGDYLFYRNWRGNTFAILSEFSERGRSLAVFQMDAKLELESVCTVPWSE